MSDAPRLALDGLTCTVASWRHLALGAGETAALAGPSGSGKSRLLRAIADLDPNAGRAWLDGMPREAFSGHGWRREVAYLPADSAWWADRVGDHLPDLDADVLSLLGFGPDVADWPVQRLSTGERSRLALARAVALRPRVLLLDEPTAHLDTLTTESVERVIERERASGVSLVWVTHDEDQVARMRAQRFRIHNSIAEAIAP